MSQSSYSAGQPGAPRCSEAATGAIPLRTAAAGSAGVCTSIDLVERYSLARARLQMACLLAQSLASHVRVDGLDGMESADLVLLLAGIENHATAGLRWLQEAAPQGYGDKAADLAALKIAKGIAVDAGAAQ